MKYQVKVVEVWNVLCTYVIDAETPDEAINKAQIGNTEDEEAGGCDEVIHREVGEVTIFQGK